MLRLKAGVKLDKLHYKMLPVLVEAEKIYAEEGHDLWITSGMDGVHSANSLHYRDDICRAIDLRTRFFTTAERKLVCLKLKKVLGREYDVVDEEDHFHIEYDPK